MQYKEVHMICFEEKFMVMIDHPALINYNKTKLTEQWTIWDRQQVIVMVLMMMLKIDLTQQNDGLRSSMKKKTICHHFIT